MASPGFAINGGTVNVKVSVTASGAVTALLDSTDGVRTVQWGISRTDETSEPSDYVLVQSGSVGQQVDTTALLVGTSAVIKATINAGLTNDEVDPATSQEVKFFVPLSSGLEVMSAGETDSSGLNPDRTSSLTHGAVDPINSAIRAANLPPSFTVATLPPVSPAAQQIFVTDETGGPVPAYSDGTDWRRYSDGAVVS